MERPLNITIRIQLENRPGKLAGVLEVIARAGGNLGAIDLVSASSNHLVRELMVSVSNRASLMEIIAALDNLPGVQVLHVIDRVFQSHLGGKMEIRAKRDIHSREDLSLIYTPGVARVSTAIAGDSEKAYRLTMKGNTVAVITDGSAVLGLGNIGPEAALPVMEGKAVLFKKFAGIDAIPICVNVHEPEKIIDFVLACAPTFGAINLEDIAAPGCFEIEEQLTRRLDIPVFHDDQHGTAIVTLAGLINSLKVVGKQLEAVKIVISGAGAAGVAITKILLDAGAKDIVVCDRKGAISRDNLPQQPSKRWLAEHTNQHLQKGGLKEVITGADVFIGVSSANLLNRADITRMASKPVVFALANPDPEVEPEDVHDLCGVIATGRSDYPNQINNALAFPGVFRGALDCHARMINDSMCLAAAQALAGIVKPGQMSAEYIIPSIFNEDVCPAVARAVENAARITGVSRKHLYEKVEGSLLF
ncbi:NAD-dependent malic enzyme [Desulfotruncus alcoholivorax]|uniref:NAD-dependent malic enzyme n=1 Tax=Desulfotruncus alcoholivorax TaxID=265477 RepID=UPI00048320E0|nr:NAD-dependent malic enzyme [Desulfotruncus alcoholivorax]